MTINPRHAVPSLVRGELLGFLRPFLRPQRSAITWSLMAGAVGVMAGALVPLIVESALEAPSLAEIIELLACMVVSFIAIWIGQRFSYIAATNTAVGLADYIYDSTLGSVMLRQIGLRRPSVISRHTSDVDRIEDAVDTTLTDGIPSVLRILISLVLLAYVVPSAGVIMIVAVLAFTLLYLRIGSGLLVIDRRRLDASSDVGALVDESITASRNVTGMNLGGWMQQRLRDRVEILRHATQVQKRQIRRMVNAARFVGFVALLAVVLNGLIGGASTAGAIAASLLYINEVVRGLEQLPPWLRSVRLATTSKRRVERITAGTPRVARDTPPPRESVSRGLEVSDLVVASGATPIPGTIGLPREGVIAVVADSGISISALLEVLGGDSDPESGVVTLDGGDVRHPMVKHRLLLIANVPYVMDTSVRDHLRAVDPFIDHEGLQQALASVGLSHLDELGSEGLDTRLGTHGELLSVHERQRLLLAMARTSSADWVLVESLPVLSDADAAMPLLREISGPRRRPVLVATRSSDLAEASDWVVALVEGDLLVGRHSELVADRRYVDMWERQSGLQADARVLEALPESQREAMRDRLVTERFAAGDVLFRAGAPADRIMYVLTGRVAVYGFGDDGHERRIAEIGPGNFCGDIDRLGGRHTTTLRAVHDTLVRTASVEAWSAGVMGLLDSDPWQRRVLTSVMRASDPGREAVIESFPTDDRDRAAATIDTLIDQGLLREDNRGALGITIRRRQRAGAQSILDRL